VAARTGNDRHVYPLVALAFCAAVFVFVWRSVDTRLLYHGDMTTLSADWWIAFPPFFLGRDFLLQHLRQPGGLVAYLAKLLMQYYCFAGVGALIVAAVAGALLWSAHAWGAAIAVVGYRLWAFLPPLILLGMASSFLLQLDPFLAVVAALACVAAYGLLAARRHTARWSTATLVVLSPALCWILGGAYLVCAVGCGLVEWRRHQRRWLALLLVLYAIGLFCGATYVARLLQPDEGFNLSWPQLARTAYESLRPTLLVLGLAVLVLTADVIARRRSRASRPVRDEREQTLRAAAGIAVLAGVTVLTSYGLVDQESRTLLRANYFARTNQWSALLDEITSSPPAAYSPGLLYDINRALLETGQLGDRMFEFPQDPQFLLQLGGEAVPHRGCFALLLRLGCVNEAEHVAYEALEVRGPRPYLLRDLAVIHIVKDRPDAARVFLRWLTRDLIYGSWARERLRQLAEDPRLENDPEVSEIRQRMMREDCLVVSNYDLLSALTQENPHNRAALEYLTAYYLLNCQLEQVVKQLPKLREAGFDHLPTSYGEALLLFCQLSGQQPDAGGWTLSREAMGRFDQFMTATRGRQRNMAALSQMLGGSYYLYFVTHQANTHEASAP
jgi:hypothetical protein